MSAPRPRGYTQKARIVTKADLWAVPDAPPEGRRRLTPEERAARREQRRQEWYDRRWSGPLVHKHCIGCGKPVGPDGMRWPVGSRVRCGYCLVARARQQAAAKQAHAPQAKPYACPYCGTDEREHECHAYAQEVAKFTASRGPLRAGVPWSWKVEQGARAGAEPPWQARADYEEKDVPMISAVTPAAPATPYVLWDARDDCRVGSFPTLAAALGAVRDTLSSPPDPELDAAAVHDLSLGYDDGERLRLVAAEAALARLARNAA